MNAIVSNFFTNYEYPFYGRPEKPHYRDFMKKWIDSINELGLNAFILYDEDNPEMLEEFESERIKFVKVSVSSPLNPIDSRWEAFRDFLEETPSIENVFFTDLWDVTVLANPFNYIKRGILYIGDEPLRIGDTVFVSQRVDDMINQPELTKMIAMIKPLTLVNCGLVGGHRKIVLEAIDKMIELLKQYQISYETVDMIAFNVTMHLFFPGRFMSGPPINTQFAQWDMGNKNCWFQHK